MSNPPLSTTGLVMPGDFAVAPYEAVHAHVSARNVNDLAWSEYAGAWNAVAHRFRACTDHDEAFTHSIRQAGDAPIPPERYVQERELFNFFVNGLSTIESLCYGLFAIGAMVNSARFPLATPKDLKFINPEKTATTYRAAFRGGALTGALGQLVSDPQFASWKDARHILAHRSAPGRTIYMMSVGSAPVAPTPAQWKIGSGVPLDASTTVSRRAWLAAAISSLLTAADSFTAHHL